MIKVLFLGKSFNFDFKSIITMTNRLMHVFRNEDNLEINMKRESKAYSYKEQLEELQLRRELEERKQKDGKNKTPKEYTQKQKDAIKLQTTKENAIRTKLFKV